MLYRYRFLRAPQLVAFIRPKSEKRFIERLGDLYHEAGLVDRPKAQWRRFDARYQPIIYELSQKGLRYLETYDDLPSRAVTFTNGGSPAQHFEHAMMVVDALVSAELEAKQTPHRRFVPVDEIMARMPAAGRPANSSKHRLAVPVTIAPNKHLPFLKKPFDTHLVPDALYGIEQVVEGEKRYRFYAVECENRSPKRRSTARYSSLALKRAAYEALVGARLHRTIWGIPNIELRVIGRKGDLAVEPSTGR